LELKVDGNSRRWYYRWQPGGTSVWVPLGALADRPLKAARELARTCRNWRAEGKDPRIEFERQAQQHATAEQSAQAQAQRDAASLEKVATDFHTAHLGDWTEKHGAQWISSLKQHVFPTLGAKPIGEIKPADLLTVLQPLRAQIPETASRVRARLDEVFTDAILHELTDTNPAAAIRKAMRGKRMRGHHAAMDWRELPAFLTTLREFDRINVTSALAFEFLILTAARTSEVLKARWAEVDEKGKIWTIPAERMKKTDQPHVVFLSDRALAILKEARPYDGQDLLFPSAGRPGHALSNMVFLQALKRMGLWGKDVEGSITAHGFRATFSTWANEHHYPRDVIEASLSHSEGNAVRAAYNRAQYIDARKALAQAWSDYCASKPQPKHKSRKGASHPVAA
jgi:integrase